MRTVLTGVAALVLALACLNAAQAPGRPPELPVVGSADGAWTIAITSSGGLTGLGRGAVTLTSQGEVTCLLPLRACEPRLIDSRLQPIAKVVASFDPATWISPTPHENLICSDCFTITFIFHRRESGRVKTTTLSWNDATRGKIPPDVVKLVENILQGKW